MKPRRVVVTLELTTDAPVKNLRKKDFWWIYEGELPPRSSVFRVEQVQVNVIKDTFQREE